MRLAFVGQSTFFEACALEDGVHPGFETRFVEFRKDADPGVLRRDLDAFEPDAVVVFRPEVLPAGVFEDVRVPILGFLTEPIPRTEQGGLSHEDLQRRLWELQQVDPRNVDRVVAFDPHIAGTAESVLPVWRSCPLPVADRYYSDRVEQIRGKAKAVFVGRSTKHRERMLMDAKHLHDTLHLAFGVDAEELERVMRTRDVAFNLHNEPYPSFENRVCLHLAAGHLVFSEPLSPLHGLEPGIDLLEFRRAYELHRHLVALERTPGLWHSVRVRGRRKAEQFRASRVWPRLINDLQLDVAAFGRPR